MAASVSPQYIRYKCVFDEENGVFRAPNGQEIEINADCEVYFQGSTVKIEYIGEGSEAVITQENTEIPHIIQADLVLFLPKPTLRSQFQEGILSFSRRMFPTSLLHSEYPSSLPFHTISSQFPAIRKVNGAGNNDFWAAVGIAYLEHLSTPLVPAGELAGFLEKLEEIKGLEVGFMDAMHELRRAKERVGVAWVEGKADNIRFQRQFVACLKAITVQYAKSHLRDAIVSRLPYGPEGFETQLLYTNAVDLDAFTLLSKALSIRLVIYSADTDYQRTSINNAPIRMPYIYLLHHFEGYYILYSRAKLEAQGYDLITNTRTGPIDEISGIGVREALYSHWNAKENEGNEKSLGNICKNSLERHIAFNGALQKVILAVMNTIKQRQSGVLFFNEELCTATKAAIQLYSQRFSSFQSSNLPTFLGDSQHLAAADFPSLARSVLNLCPLCEKQTAFWQFECGHSACRSCISSHLNLLYDAHSFLINLRGQPTDVVRCMRTDCHHVLSKEEFIRVTNAAEYERLLRETEEMTLKRYCRNCDTERENAGFLYEDPCKLCDVCVVGRILLHNSICLCGNPIPESIKSALAAKKSQCANCGAAKSLLDHFTHSICQDHSQLCRDCLCEAAESGRCSMCHRVFSEVEKREFQVYFYKICDLGCRRLISKAQAVKLTCSCYYCLDCAKEQGKRTLRYRTCVRCDKATLHPETLSLFSLDLQVQEFAIKTSIREIARKATECPLCLNRIGLRYEFSLECGHVFHLDCFKEYLISYTDVVIQRPVECPMKGCRREIAGNILNEMMDEERFHKYSKALTEISFNIRNCVNCREEFEYEGVRGSSRVACPKCNTSFCSICRKPWVMGHDEKICRHTEIQMQISVLETKGAHNQRVAQCPGCQTPYLKDEHCNRVVCVHPDCRIEWCFECSAPQKPILAHHNQWHRPSCRFYVRVKALPKEQFSPKCPNCVALGELCKPPDDLKVPRRFALSEY
jgi:hypothetical protein